MYENYTYFTRVLFMLQPQYDYLIDSSLRLYANNVNFLKVAAYINYLM